MPTPLYLDMARLGPMSPLAQRLHQDFSRLVAEDPASPLIEDFLRLGFATLSAESRAHFGGLDEWTGLAGLKASVRRFVGASDDSSVLIAGRSRSLMKVAARCLFERCHNVLTTDLSWPAYQSILEDEARRTGQGVTQIALRQKLFHQQTTLDQVAAALAGAARHYHCDGLFVPAVDNLGIRLPVAEIAAAIRQHADLKLVAIDAAQAIGHVPIASDVECSDLVIAGTHKWLGAYLPLGLAILGNQRSRPQIIDAIRAMQAEEALDDPLLEFLDGLETESLGQHTETINLTPLLTCCGALKYISGRDRCVEVSLSHQLKNAMSIRSLAEATGWRPLLFAAGQRTGIVMLQSGSAAIQSLSAESLRRWMQHCGITATAYEAGMIRLSMPRTELKEEDRHRIRSALQHVCTANVHEPIPRSNLPTDCVSSAAC